MPFRPGRGADVYDVTPQPRVSSSGQRRGACATVSTARTAAALNLGSAALLAPAVSAGSQGMETTPTTLGGEPGGSQGLIEPNNLSGQRVASELIPLPPDTVDDLIDGSVPNMLQPSEVACTDASTRFTAPEGTLDHPKDRCLNLARVVVRSFPSDRCDEHPESYIVTLQFIPVTAPNCIKGVFAHNST